MNQLSNDIADLTAKLAASIQREEQYRIERDEIALTTSSLQKECSLLSSLLDQQRLDHILDLKIVSKRSLKQGSKFVIDEVQKLWTSAEYAAELMFGIDF